MLLEPRTVVRKCLALWVKPRTDLDELARLRLEKRTIKELCAHFGRSRSGIKSALRSIGTLPASDPEDIDFV